MGASADSQGEFSIKGVLPGSYIISASLREKDKYYNTQQKIEVGLSKVDSVGLAMGSGAAIHGRLVTASGAKRPSEHIAIHLQSMADEGGVRSCRC